MLIAPKLKQPKSSSTGTGSSGTTEETASQDAGSCSAPYSVCLLDGWDDQKKVELLARQNNNEQWFSTAGIAHAELGLKSIQLAMANDGNGEGESSALSPNGLDVSVDSTKASVEQVNAMLAAGQAVQTGDLTGLIGTGMNTAWAEKIVALMNLELGQRLNQGNMLQGSALTIEASRALKKTGEIIEQGE